MRRTFSRVTAIAALLGGFLLAGCAAPAAKETTAQCAGPEWEWETYRAKIVTKFPEVAWVEIPDSERYLLNLRMNLTANPRTGFAFDRAGYFKHPTSYGVVLVFLVGDCVWLDQLTSEFAVYMAILYGKGT